MCDNIISVLCFDFLTMMHVGSLFPDLGSSPTHSVLDGEVLTTGPPGKSLPCYLDNKTVVVKIYTKSLWKVPGIIQVYI